MNFKERFVLIQEKGIEDIGLIINSYKEYCIIKIKDKELHREITDNLTIMNYNQLREYYTTKGVDLSLENLILSLLKFLDHTSFTPKLETLVLMISVNIDFLRLELKSLNLSYHDLIQLAREKKINPSSKSFVRWKRYYSVISDHAQNRLISRFGLNADELIEVIAKWLPQAVEVTKIKKLDHKALFKHGSKARYIVNFTEKCVFVMSESFDTIITVYNAEDAEWIEKSVQFIKAIHK